MYVGYFREFGSVVKGFGNWVLWVGFEIFWVRLLCLVVVGFGVLDVFGFMGSCW